jgi:orotate phosphoribosyltransferase
MIMTWYRDRPKGWWLQSGTWSPYYVNQRPLPSFPSSQKLLKTIGTAMGRMIKEEAPEVNKIVGIATTGIPLATAITIQEGIPSCYTRKLEGVETIEEFEEIVKGHGQHEQVEGELNDDDVLALVDDLVTKFKSKLIGREQVNYTARQKNVKVTCNDVEVLLDREQGAEKTARELGMSLHSVIKFKTDGVPWLKDSLSSIEYDVITDYMENDAKYQERKLQEELKRMAIKT